MLKQYQNIYFLGIGGVGMSGLAGWCHEKKYNIADMIKGDVIFCATGVTDGEMLGGIKDKGDFFEANSFILHKSQNVLKKITNTLKK